MINKNYFKKLFFPLTLVTLLVSSCKNTNDNKEQKMIEIYLNDGEINQKLEVDSKLLVKDLKSFANNDEIYINFYSDKNLYKKLDLNSELKQYQTYYVLKERKDLELIKNKEQFLNIKADGHYKLNCDLDFNGEIIDLGFSNLNPFIGYFNGDGFTIKNYKLPDTKYSSIFGYVKGTIYDLNVNTNINESFNNSTYISPLVSYLNEGILRECNIYGDYKIISSKERGSTYLGGINARNENGNIILSSNYANLSLSTNFDSYVGGISTYNSGNKLENIFIDYCASYSKKMTSVSTNSNSSSYIGGLVGFNFGKINHSICAIDPISGRSDKYQSYVGGLVGDNNGGIIFNSISGSNLNNVSQYGYSFTGNVVGRNFRSNMNEMSGETFSSYGLDIQNIKSNKGNKESLNERYYIDSLSLNELNIEFYKKIEFLQVFNIKEGYFPSLNNSFKKIYEGDEFIKIENSTDFENIINDLNGKYILKENITISDDYKIIGTYTNPFNGFLDGNNKTITIKLKKHNDIFNGIFGYLNGVVKNLNINFELEAIGKENLFIGSLAGYSIKSLIKNVHSNISFNINSNGISLGGLAGVNEAGTIINSSVKGNINTSIKEIDSFLGGLVGKNDGIIERSFYRGEINNNGGSEVFIGGLSGKNNLDINSCYSINKIIYENVKDIASVGGFSGSNFELGKIQNSYSISEINMIGKSDINLVGGFIGDNLKMITNCYYKINEDIKYSAGESLEFMKIKRVSDEELLSLAKDLSNDFKDGKNGYPILNYEME